MKKIIIKNADRIDKMAHASKLSLSAYIEGPDNMEVSDGYHTFDELYNHRIALWIALCRLVRGRNAEGGITPVWKVWRSKLHADGSKFEGWFILGIGIKSGDQLTYHLPLSKWEDTVFAETLDRAPEFDGHMPKDVIERLKRL